MTDSGWVRLTPRFALDGVTWWFYRSWDDGFSYARGGRVRSARAARKMLRQCWDASQREHRAFLERPEFALGEKGQLVPLHLPGLMSRNLMRSQK